MKRTVSFGLALLLGLVLICAANAADPVGWFGLSLDVDVEGYLNPTLRAVKVTGVVAGSPASSQGILAGDEVVSVNELRIAGGRARQIQAAMAKAPGETLRMQLRHPSGELYTVTLTAARKPGS